MGAARAAPTLRAFRRLPTARRPGFLNELPGAALDPEVVIVDDDDGAADQHGVDAADHLCSLARTLEVEQSRF